MSSGQILFLGAVAGGTIFLGLPLGRMQSVRPGVTLFLSAMATGILIFLLWDVLTAAVTPVEEALEDGEDGRFFWLAFLLGGGFAVGLLSLAVYDGWRTAANKARTVLMYAAPAGTIGHQPREDLMRQALEQAAAKGALVAAAMPLAGA